MKYAVERGEKSNKKVTEKKPYMLLTLQRQENVDNILWIVIMFLVSRVVAGLRMKLILEVFNVFLASFSIRYYMAFRMVSTPIPLYICFILSPFNVFSNILSIIPSGYGVKEIVVGFAANLAKMGFTEGVMATVINRVITMLVMFIVTPVFSYLLIGKFVVRKNKNLEEIKDPYYG